MSWHLHYKTGVHIWAMLFKTTLKSSRELSPLICVLQHCLLERESCSYSLQITIPVSSISGTHCTFQERLGCQPPVSLPSILSATWGKGSRPSLQTVQVVTRRNAFRAMFRISHAALLGANHKHVMPPFIAEWMWPPIVYISQGSPSIPGVIWPHWEDVCERDFHTGLPVQECIPFDIQRLVDKSHDNDNVKNQGKVLLILQGLAKAQFTSLSLWDLLSIHFIQYSGSSCCFCEKERLRI